MRLKVSVPSYYRLAGLVFALGCCSLKAESITSSSMAIAEGNGLEAHESGADLPTAPMHRPSHGQVGLAVLVLAAGSGLAMIARKPSGQSHK